jgi:hypothetical protein
MLREVELRQNDLNYKVATVQSHVRVCELDVVFMAGFRD